MIVYGVRLFAVLPRVACFVRITSCRLSLFKNYQFSWLIGSSCYGMEMNIMGFEQNTQNPAPNEAPFYLAPSRDVA